jgi:hypothetical protein
VGARLDDLDELLRTSASEESIVEATDEMLIGSGVGFSRQLRDTLSDARLSLLSRRLGRNSHPISEVNAAEELAA